ncbi:hypothetical protein CLV72_101552 [Allonocardiopsis opalescens]|uniref:Uncharacterized protein n=1 Tax=Allonocardiopsis opalescens TaxID=1144618 RepID=A0A2T0QDD1_9ACTN|nr:hypothetical protein CLV72_101552 [Allonocardiopsis opalescens]
MCPVGGRPSRTGRTSATDVAPAHARCRVRAAGRRTARTLGRLGRPCRGSAARTARRLRRRVTERPRRLSECGRSVSAVRAGAEVFAGLRIPVVETDAAAWPTPRPHDGRTRRSTGHVRAADAWREHCAVRLHLHTGRSGRSAVGDVRCTTGTRHLRRARQVIGAFAVGLVLAPAITGGSWRRRPRHLMRGLSACLHRSVRRPPGAGSGAGGSDAQRTHRPLGRDPVRTSTMGEPLHGRRRRRCTTGRIRRYLGAAARRQRSVRRWWKVSSACSTCTTAVHPLRESPTTPDSPARPTPVRKADRVFPQFDHSR